MYCIQLSPPQPHSFAIANDPLGNVMLLDGTGNNTTIIIRSEKVMVRIRNNG
jgi:hypothetical protein